MSTDDLPVLITVGLVIALGLAVAGCFVLNAAAITADTIEAAQKAARIGIGLFVGSAIALMGSVFLYAYKQSRQ